MKRLVKAVLPEALRRRLKEGRRRLRRSSLAHRVVRARLRAGALASGAPVRRDFGCGAGATVDRWYIERFLDRHADDIGGRVLEIADDAYTWRFGGDRVERSEILHGARGNPRATIVGDLCDGAGLAADRFDCVILTQTLQFVPDPEAALRTVHRILKPGGVALVTVPCISQVSRYDMDRWGDRWRFTSLGMEEMLEATFPGAERSVESHGNVLAAVAFLHGIVVEELRDAELEREDRDYELVVCARAVKGNGSAEGGATAPGAAPRREGRA